MWPLPGLTRCVAAYNVVAEQLARYLGEFDYRFSTRKMSDTARTERLMG